MPCAGVVREHIASTTLAHGRLRVYGALSNSFEMAGGVRKCATSLLVNFVMDEVMENVHDMSFELPVLYGFTGTPDRCHA